MRKRSVSGQSPRVVLRPDKIRTILSRMPGPRFRTVISVVLAVTVAGLGALVAVPAQAAGTGVLHVIQGLPGRTVDIAVDGRTVASGVKATEVVGPLTVAAGARRITAKEGGKVVLERQVTVAVDNNLDVVIHRPASPTAAPVITTYVNKLTAVPRDKGAVRVAHTAAVGPADIRVNGKVLFANVANGESLDVVVPADTYQVDIVPAGTTTPVVLGPLDLPVRAGYLTRVFAVGEPTSKTMNVAVATLKLPGAGSDKPGLVNTGTGGQAAELGLTGERQGPALPLVLLLLAGALALTVTVSKAVRR
ncbi:DUF4397 domain-containing protein [Kribbella sp. CA-293567]|uniref:DUF4397 domain-containing protein n=1 Tax=Kribbella sp. CA-293567 TaxID=3002436 RepID=UPI0022DE5536|nr:DUF4397 domain-containing protein [Kribbella sp. CA-293567]WBQ04813.1 DUF4397 domain-containing protein [Kribbella sp. CA-293567]